MGTQQSGAKADRGHPGGGLLRPLRRRLVGSEGGLVYVVLVSLALALTSLAAPVLTGAFVDYCLAANRQDWILPLLAGMGLTAVLRAVLCWLQQHYLFRLENKLSVLSSYAFFRHVLHLPVQFFTNHSGGEVGSRVQINDRIARLLSRTVAANLLSVVMAGLYVALMLCFDVLLAVIGVGIGILNFVVLRVVSRRRRAVNRELLKEQAQLTATSLAGLQAIETVKATGSESDFFSRWSGILARVIVAGQRMDLSSLLLGAVPPLLSALNMVAILGVGSLRVLEGHLTVGMLVAFQSLMASFLGPIDQFVGLGRSLQEMEGEMQRLDEVVGHPTDPERRDAAGEDAGWHGPAKLAGRLEVKEATFGYKPDEPPLLNDFSLTVPPGARVALVGASGSGKSTVARLVCGLYQPWRGEILLDGHPRGQVPRGVLAQSLAFVDQDFFLFAGTVRDVLTMWDATASEDDVIRAAKDACIHEEIAARPGGYASLVDEGGANFSGGQRQRLEIARALVNNPALLVLDEATSALDAATEKRIDENLRRRGCTCVIVAHRLSTIRDCDEIIVLEHGRIVQRGTHEQLIQDGGGTYYRLIHA